MPETPFAAAGSSWLGALPTAARDALLREARPLSLRAGETLFHQGDDGDSLAVVESGLLKAAVVTGRGREVVLDYVAAGQVIGEFSVFDGAPRAATVCAVEPSTVRLLAASSVRRLLEQDGAAALAALAALVRRLRRTNALVEDAADAPLEMRLARALLRLAPEPDGAELNLTQADLAAYAGLARENVNRQLQDWAARRLVGLGRGRLRLLARDRLVEIAEDAD